ncbi:MAG TPA: hypothetical protein VGI12_01460 [Vicinamibacterales bacterium]|jgi:hypothetical protein
MTNSSMYIRALGGVLVLASVPLAIARLSASEKPHFDSQLRDGAITIDGKYDDWYGNLQPFEQAPVAIQFLNDKDYLYMRLTASASAERREILRQGFTVWFDPAGGTKKHLGIRYPVVEHGTGGDDAGRGGYGGRRAGGQGGGSGESESPSEPSPGDRIDVLGPGKDDARMLTRDHAPGIDVAIREDQGTLQYELKVPLVHDADHPYAIDATPGKPVGIGLEAGKTSQESFGGGRPGGFGGGGGGMGGGMGGRGGGMGGRGGGGGGGSHGGGGGGRENAESAKPLKGWGTLSIASTPAR